MSSFILAPSPTDDCIPSPVEAVTLQSAENLYFCTRYEDTLPLKYMKKGTLRHFYWITMYKPATVQES